MIGNKIYKLAKRLFPLNRSITGSGTRKTLEILREHNKNLKIKSIPSGSKVFDWVIPYEWNVKDAYVKDKRTKIQASQQSKMISQRQNDSAPTDFEAEDSLQLPLL